MYATEIVLLRYIYVRTTMDGRNIYVGYDGSVSARDCTLEMSAIFAQRLGLFEDDPLQINVGNAYTQHRLSYAVHAAEWHYSTCTEPPGL